MSAGNSPAGRDFAARHADLNFALGPDLPTLAATCADIKHLARERYARELSVFTMGYVVCRETEREALRYRDYYVKEKGDFAAAQNLLETLIPNSQSALGDQYRAMIENFIAGYSAMPLVGTPEQVVDGWSRWRAPDSTASRLAGSTTRRVSRNTATSSAHC